MTSHGCGAESSEPAGWRGTWAFVLLSAIGVLVVTSANALSRTGRPGGHAVFWIGLVIIVLPIAWAVMREDASRSERLVLVTSAAAALYLVKVVHDPFAFTFTDEFVHQHNTNEVLRSGTLFGSNSILPITPYYPGLSSATAAVAALTGLSTFGTGLIVIGAARLIGTLAMFMLAETLLRSQRAAAVAALAYVGAPNYLFFSAQFAYESLALPVALLVLVTVVRRAEASDVREARRWTALGVCLVPAVVVTHHLTSYALLATLTAVCAVAWTASVIADRRAQRTGDPPSTALHAPVALTAALAVVVAGWLVLAGRRTSDYLSPVFIRAISQTWDVLSQEAPPRALFQPESDAIGATAPIWERLMGLASVVVLIVWITLGVVALRRQRRRSPVLLLLALGALTYLGTFPLRFVPAAWETAARASEFLFVGVSTVVAATVATRGSPAGWRHRGVVALAVTLVAAGGIVAGWPTDRRLSASYRIDVDGAVVEPEQITFAKWSSRALSPDQRIATEQSAARVLQLYGGHFAVAGRNPDVEDILHLPPLDPWMLTLLREERFRYIAVDRRGIGADETAGYFFTAVDSSRAPQPEVHDKFDRAGATRVFDSGAIVLYDIRPLIEPPPDG